MPLAALSVPSFCSAAYSFISLMYTPFSWRYHNFVLYRVWYFLGWLWKLEHVYKTLDTRLCLYIWGDPKMNSTKLWNLSLFGVSDCENIYPHFSVPWTDFSYMWFWEMESGCILILDWCKERCRTLHIETYARNSLNVCRSKKCCGQKLQRETKHTFHVLYVHWRKSCGFRDN